MEFGIGFSNGMLEGNLIDADDASKTSEVRRVVGGPATTRRQCETPAFRVSDFQSCCTTRVAQLDHLLKSIAPGPCPFDLGVEDLSFHTAFLECEERFEAAGKVPNKAGKIVRKRDFLNKNKKQRGRERKRKRKGEVTGELSTVSLTTASTGQQWESSLYSDVAENAGNRYMGRSQDCGAMSGDDDNLTSSLNPTQEEHKETSGQLRVKACMEHMTRELHCVYETMTIHNSNTNENYRAKLFEVFQEIGEIIQGKEGEYVATVRSTYGKTKRKVPQLTQDEREALQGKVDELAFQMNCEKQGTLENWGYKFVSCAQRRKLLRDKNTAVSGDINGEVPETSVVLRQQDVCSLEGINQEVVIMFRIMHPTLLKSRNCDILALGRHTLADVISKYKCVTCFNMSALGRETDSQYVFMEGTFHKAGREDYTKNIKEFCRENKCGWPLDPQFPYHTTFRDKELDTPLEDLILRVTSKPLYIYCHHGSCEHLIQVMDVRLLHSEDPPQIMTGPVVLTRVFEMCRQCNICLKESAKKVTYGSSLGLHDPSFLCQSCFTMLHYDEKGNLTSNKFLVFPYQYE